MTLTTTDIDHIVQAVAELPDRTSPDGWPEAMLVTERELRDILETAPAPRMTTPPEMTDSVKAAYDMLHASLCHYRGKPVDYDVADSVLQHLAPSVAIALERAASPAPAAAPSELAEVHLQVVGILLLLVESFKNAKLTRYDSAEYVSKEFLALVQPLLDRLQREKAELQAENNRLTGLLRFHADPLAAQSEPEEVPVFRVFAPELRAEIEQRNATPFQKERHALIIESADQLDTLHLPIQAARMRNLLDAAETSEAERDALREAASEMLGLADCMTVDWDRDGLERDWDNAKEVVRALLPAAPDATAKET